MLAIDRSTVTGVLLPDGAVSLIEVGVTPMTGAPTSRLVLAVAVRIVAVPEVQAIADGAGCDSTVLNEYSFESEPSAFCRPIVALMPSSKLALPKSVDWYWNESEPPSLRMTSRFAFDGVGSPPS